MYDGSSVSEGKLSVQIGENARLTHYKVVSDATAERHHSFLEAALERSAIFQSHVFLFGGLHVRNTIQVRMNGEGADCTLNGLYLAAGKQVMESHTLIDHVQPHGTSRELYKGILDDQSVGHFDGLIVVGKDAQKTDSAQSNKNLLLSSSARAKSDPQLKIFANDVKCKHGSTVGQVDANQLFYFQSRGIPKNEARRLLIYAFASEMINQVRLLPLREALEKLLFQKFEAQHV
jgi:Fe-S cluster assembly protein SufD